VTQPASGKGDLSSATINKAECDAEVGRAYPAYIWAPGLGKKREELFAACMAKAANAAQPGAATSNSPAIDKAECDAEVGQTYPAYIWAPGLNTKRKELFAACTAKRGRSVDASN
jgi:hypothetical protein